MRGIISRSSFRVVLGLATAAVIVNASTARAAIIVDPLTATYAATNTGTGANGLLTNGGLSTALATPGTTVTFTPGSMPTDNNSTFDFRANDKTNGLTNPIFFNLNTTPGTGGSATGYNITGIYLYNYNADFVSQRGFYKTDLQYSTNNGTSYTDFGSVTFAPASSPNTGTGNAADPGALVNLGSTLSNVTNVEFLGITNFDDPTNPSLPAVHGNGDFTGAQQLRFVATPEPASLGLLSLGAMTLLARRRRTA